LNATSGLGLSVFLLKIVTSFSHTPATAIGSVFSGRNTRLAENRGWRGAIRPRLLGNNNIHPVAEDVSEFGRGMRVRLVEPVSLVPDP
jgi:hypothetical protein